MSRAVTSKVNRIFLFMEEEWRSIKDYEGLYEVSNLGRVKSFHKSKEGKVLKSGKDSGGYCYFGLAIDSKKQKNKSAHQLVAIAFLNHTPNGHKIVVDHIDNNKLNNRVDNLQLISHRENISKDNRADFTGVQKDGKKFKSEIRVNGIRLHLGTFTTPEEASLYYQNAVLSIENGTDIVVKKPEFSSKYKGVCWHKRDNKWASRYKRKFLGLFTTEEEAHKAYEKSVKTVQH